MQVKEARKSECRIVMMRILILSGAKASWLLAGLPLQDDLKNFIQDKLSQLVNKDLITISELENAWNILLENKGFGYSPNFSDLAKFVCGDKKEQKTSTNVKSKRSGSNGA